MDQGCCPVCQAPLTSLDGLFEHRDLHGERRLELAKARLVAKLLRTLPRGHPGRPYFRLLSTPRLGLPDEERFRQNLDALCRAFGRPGGEAFLRGVLAEPAYAARLLDVAERQRPDVAARLRALAGAPRARPRR